VNKFERLVNNFEAGDRLLILRSREGVWILYEEATITRDPDFDFKFNFKYDGNPTIYNSDASELEAINNAGSFAMVLKRDVPEELLFQCVLSNTYDEVLRYLGYIQ